MIEFTSIQESRSMRNDCRIWTELMVEAWYASNYPNGSDFPFRRIVSDLRAVFFACSEQNIADVELISVLGFANIKAKTLMCSQVDIDALVQYFCNQAKANNVELAQNWIEIYLDGET